MTDDQKELFIANRTRAQATVILTRRSDLVINDTKRDTGIDLHVRIDREESPMRLTFGVLLRGASSPTTSEAANAALRPAVAQFRGMRNFTYPVCLFYFTMKDDQGYFSWLAEPAVVGGAPKLLNRDRADCKPLTTEVLNDTVERVVAWYDALEPVLIG